MATQPKKVAGKDKTRARKLRAKKQGIRDLAPRTGREVTGGFNFTRSKP